MKKKILALLLCVAMVMSLLSGCSSKDEKTTTNTKSTKTKSGKVKKGSDYGDEITIDVFDSLANYQGIQSGWFAKIVKDKFNMKLNIIAPNVAGGGDTLFQTRSAAGNLGDLIVVGTENGRFKDMVTAGLLEDMTPYLKDSDLVKNYGNGIKSLNAKVEQKGTFAIPSEISSQSATTPSEGLQLTYGPYIRWDLYKAAGYPQVKTLEDVIPVLKQIQTEARKTDKKAYAMSLFKDWDGNMMCLAKQPTCFYGYDELGFALCRADGSDVQSIIDSNSQYVRTLKFFYNANKEGLVDPESTTQKYDTLQAKYKKGQILFSFWPWLGASDFNTPAHTKEGKGFELMPIDDMQIISNGCNPEGNQKCVMAMGSQCKDKQRVADFIDWLYSPEGIRCSQAMQTQGSSGPEGLTWEMKDGKPVLTEFGKQALYGETMKVPAKWGGGTWKDGVSALNYKAVNQTDKDPNGITYSYTLWDSVINADETNLTKDWKKQMNAKTDFEYLQKNKKMMVAPGNSYGQPEEESEIATLRGQCKAIIVEYSWKMSFAKSEAEFDSLLKEMQKTVKGLGYDKVFKVDQKNCQELTDARNAAKNAK
ncbi:hypothetical protein lbkm_0319 [Lachnospiraceae bacterium KM106-2]|nr:hypothetical protein lbkm_0319 [Lachnospiraceae bacterium KM106-2]